MYRLTTAMIIFALALGIQSARASGPDSAPSVIVRFADLDLSRSEGATALYRRLKGAAETVCAALEDRELARQTLFKACVQGAISAAVAKIDQPVLTAYYAAKTNDRNATMRIAQK